MKALKLSTLACALILGGSVALADDLQLGGTYVPVSIDEGGTAVTVGGGPITVSYLNGTPLAFVYCVGLFIDVYVPDDYPDTIVTNNGVVDGAPVNNAGEIAWLVDNLAVGAENNSIDQQALQAAIWTVEYDNGADGHPIVTGDPGAGYYSQYQIDLAALGSNTAAVSTIDWFSPGDSSGTVYQGLVGPDAPVPEPASILLLGSVLFGASLMMRKRLRAGR